MKGKALLSSTGLAKATQQRWQNAKYRYNRMHLPISGVAIYHDVDGDKQLTAGKVYLFVNSSASNFELVENEKYYHMYIDFRTIPPLLNREALEIDLEKDPYCMHLIKAIQCILQENKKEKNKTVIKGVEDEELLSQAQSLLQLILKHLNNKYGLQVIENPKIDKAIKYIEEHYTERVSNNDVAKELHIDTRYFIRLFNKCVGMTPYQYLTQCRIERAIEELRQDKTVAETALLCGYQNENAFRISFKRVMGCSPTAFFK